VRHRGSVPPWVVASFLLASLSSFVFGAQLDVAIGIGGYVSRWSYAPVRVTISGLTHPVEGRIRLVQLIGNPAEDPDHVEDLLYAGKLADRTYEATVPIYDPLNPVKIEVEDEEGDVIASSEVDLRLKRRVGAFPAVCGIFLVPADDAVLIDRSELPRDWWGFDAVRELWIGGAGATEDAWTTIGEWVTAGGSLVLFTGADFYRLDTPAVRKLLPISDPHLVTGPDGTEYLAGDLKGGARVSLTRNGIPILIIGRSAAGSAALVTVRPEELTEAEVAAIGARVPPARSLSAAPVAEAILRGTTVDRPSFLAALFLVSAVLASFLAFARGLERRPSAATAALFLAIAALTVSAGLYINRNKQPVKLYSIKLELSIENLFGIKVGLYALYATGDGPVSLVQDEGSFPVQSPLLSLAAASFDSESEPRATRIDLLAQERRDLAYYGRSSSSIAFTVGSDSASITNRSGEPIDGGLLVVGGLGYPLPVIPSGTGRVALSNGREIGLYESGRAALDLVVHRFEDRFGLDSGTWLITLQEGERIELEGGSARKVRDVRIRFIAGGRDAAS